MSRPARHSKNSLPPRSWLFPEIFRTRSPPCFFRPEQGDSPLWIRRRILDSHRTPEKSTPIKPLSEPWGTSLLSKILHAVQDDVLPRAAKNLCRSPANSSPFIFSLLPTSRAKDSLLPSVSFLIRRCVSILHAACDPPSQREPFGPAP